MAIERDYLPECLRSIAAKQGVSLDELYGRLDMMTELITRPLPAGGRLEYVENLLKDRIVAGSQADLILRNSPLLEAEVRDLIRDVQDSLGGLFGLENSDDYTIVFDEKMARAGWVGDFVNPVWKTVTLPAEGSIYTPVVVAHFLAHVFQNENSRVIQELRAAYEAGGIEAYNRKYATAEEVIEGWAVFISRQYALSRDLKLGISHYAPMEEEMRGWTGVSAYLSVGREGSKYERGYELYRRIYERHGMMGVLWAARYITSDQGLTIFADSKDVSFNSE